MEIICKNNLQNEGFPLYKLSSDCFIFPLLLLQSFDLAYVHSCNCNFLICLQLPTNKLLRSSRNDKLFMTFKNRNRGNTYWSNSVYFGTDPIHQIPETSDVDFFDKHNVTTIKWVFIRGPDPQDCKTAVPGPCQPCWLGDCAQAVEREKKGVSKVSLSLFSHEIYTPDESSLASHPKLPIIKCY